mgnify:CR=1 FL=1
MNKHLIPQYAHTYQTFSDYQDSRPDNTDIYGRSKKIIAEDLLNFERLFILGEPGYGKTTLMSQLRHILKSKEINFHYHNGVEDIEPHKIKNGIKYFLLDALDENKEVIATFLKVDEYCSDKDIKLIISNRSHYILTIRHLLTTGKFSFIKLQAFSDEQISSYLKLTLDPKKIDANNIKSLIDKTKANLHTSILCVPRYLSEFSKYIQQHKLTYRELGLLNKSQLFELVFYYKLEHDGKKKQNANQKYLTKRVLERLSLVMEIHGLNQISKEDFITFLDQTDSNISLIFLNTIDLDDLLDRVLKSTDGYLQFENTEFQEYLAAKEIVRLGYRFQTVYDLMIHPELKILSPHWIDVLNFAIDLDPEFVKPIITFIRYRKHEAIDHKLIEIIMTVRPDHFDKDFRRLFFNTVFDYYSAKGKLIYHIHERLAAYIDSNDTDILRPLYRLPELTDAVRHIQSNQILLIESLANQHLLGKEDIHIWTTYLIELVRQDELYSMQNTAFYGLIAMESIKPLLTLIAEFEQKEDYLLNNLISALTRSCPNAPEFVQLIIRCLHKPRRLDHLDVAIDNLSSESAIFQLFDTFNQYPQTFKGNTFRYGSSFYQLFNSVQKLNQTKIDETIEEFLIQMLKEPGTAIHMPEMLQRALVYLVNKDTSVIKKIIALASFPYAASEITQHLVGFIDLKAFRLIEKALIDGDNQYRLNDTIYKVKYKLEQQERSKIYQYIDQKYLQVWAKEPKETIAKQPSKPSAIRQLRDYYSDDSNCFFPALIPYFVLHADEILPTLEESDRLELVKVIETQLDNYNPERFSITTKEESPTRTSIFHNNEIWFGIETYFKAAYLLDRKDILQKYRIKLLKTVPRIDVYENTGITKLKELIEAIGPITSEDINILHDFCMDRTDDLLVLSSKSIATVARTFKLQELNPVLNMLIYNAKVKVFEKEELIKVFGEIAIGESDRQSLKQMFKTLKRKLKDLANAALISTYREKTAIQWRFKELKLRVRKFDSDHKYNGSRGVSTFEMEMERPEFPNCLYGIDMPEIYRNMLDLLTFSFELRDKKDQFSYSTYLQKIVYQYFKSYVSENVIDDLRSTIARFPIPEQTYSFNAHLDELLTDLFNQKKRPEPFINAIQGLNHILAKVYLPINSHQELKEKILSIINKDIKNLIENDGFYRLSEDIKTKLDSSNAKVGETIIQKTLKIAFEKALLEHGMRKTDIYREVENQGGLRYDYLINYGLYGPIMVELKLLHNNEIQSPKQRSEYKKKMAKYMGDNNQMGIYLIFQIHNEARHLANYRKMVTEYTNLHNLDIQLLKCYDDEPITLKQAKKVKPIPKAKKNTSVS